MGFTLNGRDFDGKLVKHLERAWKVEHPSGTPSFEYWCLAVLANGAAKILQQKTVAEVKEAFDSEVISENGS